jgi:hypothetical protein
LEEGKCPYSHDMNMYMDEKGIKVCPNVLLHGARRQVGCAQSVLLNGWRKRILLKRSQYSKIVHEDVEIFARKQAGCVLSVSLLGLNKKRRLLVSQRKNSVRG